MNSDIECKMSECPLTSIIVPNYNNANYLSACFNSILNQTHINVEIVVIDDASTDNSWDVIKHYQNFHPDKISALFLRKNGGVAHARHIGIIQSKGENITTLNAYDYYP